MTGTKDIAPIGNTDMKLHLSVFPALPSGGKYELVLYGANHFAFSDRSLSNNSGKPNPNHHRVILALSTDFWDTWLHGSGPGSVLEKDDRWQIK